jgi:hypothetical protein
MRVDVNDTSLTIPVYKRGINTAVSILPESDAAAWGTIQMAVDRTQKLEGNTHMNARVQAALQKIFQGDETVIEEFAGQVDDVNRTVETEMVHRENEDVVETDTVEDVTETTEEVESAETETESEVVEITAEVEVDVTPELVDVIYQQISDRIMDVVNQAINANNESVNGLFAEMRQLRDGLRELNTAVNEVVEEQTVINEDKPVKVRKVLTVRARSEQTETPVQSSDKTATLAETAHATLKNIYGAA